MAKSTISNGIETITGALSDKSHPRFMELYHRWRAQLSDPDPYKQFLPFIRTVLASEKSPN